MATVNQCQEEEELEFTYGMWPKYFSSHVSIGILPQNT